MDMSFAGYLSFIPFLLLTISIFNTRIICTILKVYTYLCLFFTSLLFVLDLELFRVWGYKIDVSILKYLDSPTEVIASSLASPILLLVFLFLFQSILFLFIYNKFIHKKIDGIHKEFFWKASAFLLLTAFLFIPIRGGFGLSPMNQSTVCFSNNNFANQAAINYAWNFFDTVVFEQDDANPYVFMENSAAESILTKLYSQENSSLSVLKNERPNIVFIIWESFTYKLLNENGVVPEFNSLIDEGIFFDNIYANGDRSDKGLVALFSGYPTIPGKSIINKIAKASKLPHISKALAKENYESAFFYGGEIEFFRLKSYLATGDYSFIESKKNFSEEDMNSKWGAHDHVVYKKLEDKIMQANEPFFYSMFTLSSHEPFEIPIEPLIKDNDEESKFLNSHNYADKSLGNFISNMKKSRLWDNTLFIIVADHGHRLPKNSKYFSPEAFHIPMLWIGGALSVTDTVIHSYGNQTDIAKTLLSQMNMNSDEFKWSNNLFEKGNDNFAYYSFSYGYGLVKDSSTIIYDAQFSRYLEEKGLHLDKLKKHGKAILQSSYQDYYDK
jgi:phosphoglycerol transferase MdoB-like AlkP superfamily enzyme